MVEKIILDADICLKLGGSGKYQVLYELVPLLARNVYIHKTTFEEILSPKAQITQLIAEGKVHIVSEADLDKDDRKVYDMTYDKLYGVMKDPTRSRKNVGEVCALAYGCMNSLYPWQAMPLVVLSRFYPNIYGWHGKDGRYCISDNGL